jgi:spore coat polysaccharide biosynthesis protein SpsF
MGSTRLPGKVLKEIQGCTMLQRVFQRTRQAKLLDDVVVVTSTLAADDAIVAECSRMGAPYFRGSDDDVLDRFYQAMLQYRPAAIVRITSDCPLIDSSVIDLTIREFMEKAPDYASNSIIRCFPRGLDTEVMTAAVLERAWREADQPWQRIHVTPYIYQNPQIFRMLPVTADCDLGALRWTVDTPEDLEFVRAVYAALRNTENFDWHDVLEVLRCHPELAEINAAIVQKATHEG